MAMKHVLVSKYKENCYILISAKKKNYEGISSGYNAESFVSLLYDAGTVAAEWEIEHGPIQIWYKASELKEGTRQHYYYDFVIDTPMNWSQMAVEKNELPQAAVRGDWDYIFAVLEDWASRR